MKAAASQRPTAPQRRAARLAAIQALYQWEMTGGGAAKALIAEFAEHRLGRIPESESLPEPDAKLFAAILDGAIAHLAEIDDMLAGLLAEDWPFDRLTAILRALLRCGAFELAHAPQVPPKVVISEYVALAGLFFDEKEIGMTNGILDKLAKALRAEEMASQRNAKKGN